MSKQSEDNVYRENFRPNIDSSIDQQIDAALDGISEEVLYADKPQHEKSTTGDKQMRSGRIVQIDKDDIFVDFGGKSQGIVSRLQFVGTEEPVVGQEMEFVVDKYDTSEGLLLLSRRGATNSNVSWENLEVGQILEATVTGHNKGGLELEVKKMRAFMPAGQVELFHVPDFADYVGKKLNAEVTRFEREGKNIVLSRRNILEREKEEQKKKLLEELAEGQVRRGTVRNVMDFGAFVDLGGVDGLLHVSEMTFKRGRQNAADFVKNGDVLDVKIVKIDKDTGKLALSLKQALGIDPWADAANKYAVGSSLTGRVTRVEAFGAFIEVEEGLEGLLPVSEMSWQRIRHPNDVVKEGDTIKLIVLSVDPAARRISFSLKQAGIDPWAQVADRYAVDTNVTGKVTRLVDFGAFVELEAGLEGLIHISELSTKDVRSVSQAVKVGEEVRVRILEISKEQRRMSLSLKRAAETERNAAQDAAAAVAAAAAPKKKRPVLRGGLDY